MNIAVLIHGTETTPAILPLVMSERIADAKYSIYHLQTQKKDFEYAVKIFPKNKAACMAFCREKKILTHLNHEHIIKFIPNIRFDERNFDCYFLPMEYAPHGDFFDFIFSQELNNEKLLRAYIHQLVDGVEYMHSKKIAHLDLKLENLLLGKDYSLKIADFDQSQPTAETTLLYRGSPAFRAPEVVSRSCTDFFAADLYSIGVILFAFATGEFPFLEKDGDNGDIILMHYDLFCDNNKQFWDLRLGQKSDKSLFKDPFQEIINGLLNKDPKARWTIRNVKESSWYKGETLTKEELRLAMEKLVTKKIPETRGVAPPMERVEHVEEVLQTV